ncbi:hypothetical protein CATRI_00975 [Corynebacterium atrinae]|nr:hypothetical protein CATRI_00975 [Corynebacterium atrinae]
MTFSGYRKVTGIEYSENEPYPTAYPFVETASVTGLELPPVITTPSSRLLGLPARVDLGFRWDFNP